MAKARPERIRFTLWDAGAPGSTPLELPARRMWPIGLVFAVFFAIFAGIAWVQIVKMSSHDVGGVFDLMFVLFEGFWVLGWSVGVLILGALTVLFLFYRESARLEGGRLVHVPRLGPFRIVCEYDLARVRNIRLEPAKHEEKVRIRFDYGNGSNGLGDAMSRAEAEALVEEIRGAAAKYHPHPHRPPEGEEVSRTAVDANAPAALRPAPLTSPSGLALIGANLLPLAGVLVFGWDLSNVMVLYWAESAVIGFYTALKAFVVGKWVAPFAVMFFVGHFGGFMAIHFMFVYGFFIHGGGSLAAEPGALEGLLDIFGPLWPALAALFVSHGVSFFVNFISRREHVGTTLTDLMTAPYKRIMIMHVTIIFGGFVVMLLDTPAPALALLVMLKTVVDFRAHLGEHRKVMKKSDQKAR